MNRLHTLLAATDFSDPSRDAALRAAMLARQTGAKLELLHVMESSALNELRRLIGEDGEALQKRLRLQAQGTLSQLAAEISDPLGVRCGEHLLEGAVLKIIAAQADLLNASLLVLGARGEGNWLLGAITERVLRKTLRPVLAVRQRPKEAYQSVLVPVDFSPWSRGAIGLAQAVAPQAELILMNVFEVPFEGKMRFAGVDEEVILRYRNSARREAVAALEKIAADARAVGNWRSVVVHGDAAFRILGQEKDQGADLVVLGKHGVGVAEELLLGSVTKHVLIRASCDVLVAHR
jgi:nucleotide-binding universal stress UspA family protein